MGSYENLKRCRLKGGYELIGKLKMLPFLPCRSKLNNSSLGYRYTEINKTELITAGLRALAMAVRTNESVNSYKNEEKDDEFWKEFHCSWCLIITSRKNAGFCPTCIAKIFVYKHCFCYLNVRNVKQKELFVSPANSSLVGILITIRIVTGIFA